MMNKKTRQTFTPEFRLESAWSENSVIEKLQNIARQKLSINDLQQHPELENALLEAYQLGKEAN